jgi:hypothetical protein
MNFGALETGFGELDTSFEAGNGWPKSCRLMFFFS